MPPPPPPPGSSVRTFGGYITVDERRFWESYLLEERMLDPRFQVGLITAEKRKEFLETVALPEHVQDEQVFQKKVKYLISTYLYAKDQKHYRGRRHEIEAIAAYNKIALHQGAPLYDKENIANNNKQWCRLAARFVTQVEGDLDERLRTGEMPPSNYDAREQASSNEAQENFNETVQMNVAIERSLQDQRAPTGLPAVAQRPGATSGSESWADRQELAKALQESRAMFAARHGRPPEAPVVIRNPEEIERERKQREQAEAREKRKEPTKSPPVKKRKKKLPPAPGGSSRPSDVARSPSPLRQPDVPMGTDDQQADQVLEDLDLFTAEDFEVSALQEPLLEGSVGAQLNLEPAAGDTQLGSQTQDVPEDLDLFTEEGFFRSIEQEPLNESVQRRLYVGPQSAVSLAEGLLDQVIAADDEIRNSPDVQNYLDLVNVSPTVQGQALLEVPALGEVGEEDWVDVTRKSIQATAEEFRHSQNPGRGFEGQGGGEGSPGEAISDWSPGQLLRWSPGSWSSGGSPGGGEPGGGGGPSSPDGGVDDDDDVNILNFVDMYERIALDHPDVLVYIRWPPKLERFNYWVMYKWPDFYTCVRWPRFIPDELPDVNLLDEYLIGVY
ncbi:hypothetical protein R1sor_016048 [Riccia sorocarpa]|uniref:Uncharacterized protein n=1 Tax=Riccia sorocarpa TaxID=122646 RepID=A0ABD3HHX5_9MARC